MVRKSIILIAIFCFGFFVIVAPARAQTATDLQNQQQLAAISTYLDSLKSLLLSLQNLLSQQTFSAYAQTASSTAPVAPSLSITPTSPNANANTLSWNGVTGATYFNLYRKASGQTGWAIILSQSPNTTYIDGNNVGGLTADAYDYHTNACNSYGCSPDSNTVSGTIPFTMPAISGSLSGANSVMLSWSAVAGSTGFYRGFRYPSSNILTTIFDNYSSTSYTDSNLAGGTYNYYMVVCNSSNVCSVSNTVTVTVSTADTTPPSTPTGLVATKDVYNEVDLSWTTSTDNVGVAGYKVWRSYNAVWSQIGTPNTTSYIDTTVSPSSPYYYYVTAYDAAGNTSASSSQLFLNTPASTATATSTVPAAPTSLFISGSSPTSIGIYWADNSTNESEFRIERRFNGGSWSQVGSVVGNTTTKATTNANTLYTDNNLIGAGTYDYQVKACNSTGCSGYSNTTSQIIDAAAPAVPSGLTATYSSMAGSVTVSWTDNSTNEWGFRTYRRVHGNTSWFSLASVFNNSTGNSVSYADTYQLATNTTYDYVVHSYNTYESADSNIVTVTTGSVSSGDVTPPSVPTGVTATALSSSSIQISWTASTDNVAVSNYKIYRSGVQVSWTSSLSYVDTGLSPGTTYTYTVAALDTSNNLSAQSGSVSATTQSSAQSPTGGTSLSPIGYWKFDGNGNNDVSGGASALVVGSAAFYSSGGKIGGYGYIPSSGNYFRIPYSSIFDLPTSFTVEFWFRQRANQSFRQDLIYKGSRDYYPSGNVNFWVWRQLWDQYNFGPIQASYVNNNTGYYVGVTNGNQLSHGAWHHVAYTKDASGSEYYLDGVSIYRNTDTAPARTNGADIIIGDTAVDTDIDDLKIYNRALSSTEVSQEAGSGGGGVPVAPSSLRQTGSTSNSITFAWNDNSLNEDKFTLERTIAGGSSWTLVNQPGANIIAYTDASVTSGTYYDYRIQACLSGYGCSAYTYVYGVAAFSSTTTASSTCPTSVVSLLGSGCHSMTSAYFNGEMTQYVYFGGSTPYYCSTNYISGCISGGTISTSTCPTSAVSLLGSGCHDMFTGAWFNAAMTQYVYYNGSTLYSCSTNYVSGCSGTTSISSSTTTPVAPSNFSYNFSNVGAMVNLTWQDNSTNESWFTIYRQPQGGSWVTLGNVGANVTSASDTPPAGTYYYQVSACGSSLCSSGVNLGPITVGGGTVVGGGTLAVMGWGLSVDSSGISTNGIAFGQNMDQTTFTPQNFFIVKAGDPFDPSRSLPVTIQKNSFYVSLVTTALVPGGQYLSVARAGVRSSSGATLAADYVCPFSGMAPGTYITSCPGVSGLATITTSTTTFATTTVQISPALLKGAVRDAGGSPIAGATVRVFRDDFSFNFGATTLSDGIFTISMRGGTYFIEVWPPFGRYDLIRPAPQKFDIKDGETKSLNIAFSASLKTISGTVTFSSGAPVTDAQVGAYASDSGQWTSTFVDASGNYKLNVGGGHWQVGIRPRDASLAKWSWTGEFPTVDFAKDSYADSRVVNFVIQSLDVKLSVQAQDQSGRPLSGAGVVADTMSASAPQSTQRPPPIFRKSDANGKADFSLVAGTYYLRAFLPPESGYVNPEEVQVQLASSDVKSITIIFKSLEAARVINIPGRTKLQGGKAASAFIWAWSEKGGSVNVRSSDDGNFVIALAPGARWHIGAGRELDNIPYKSNDIEVDTSAAPALIELVLERFGIAPLAPPVTVTQDPTGQVVVRVQDGAQVTLPPATVPGTAPINIEINPTIEAPSQTAAKVVSTVYDVNLTDNTGKSIKTLNQETEIIIPYKLEDLKAQGVTEDTVVPSFYDDSAGTWVKIDNYTIDKVKKVVVMRVKHLTRFALIAAADVTPPPDPKDTGVANGNNPGEANVSWKNPSQDFNHAKVYRSTEKGKLGDLIVNNLTAERFVDKKGLVDGVTYYYTIRAVDPAGNESLNADQVVVVSFGTSSGAKVKISRNLRIGAKGEDVKALQELLIKEGVYPEGLVTGTFGNLTRRAVILFQEKYADEILKPAGLKQGSGFVGAGTRAKIEKILQ